MILFEANTATGFKRALHRTARLLSVLSLIAVVLIVAACARQAETDPQEREVDQAAPPADVSPEIVEPDDLPFSTDPEMSQASFSGVLSIDGIGILAGRPTTPVVQRGNLLAAGSGTSLLFLDLDSGEFAGAIEFEEEVRSLAAGSRGFIVATDVSVSLISVERGVLWSTPLPSPPSTELIVTGGGLYLGLSQSVLSLAVADGSLRYRTALGATPVDRLVLSSGRVIAATSDGSVFSLAARTGEIQWERESDSPPVHAPSVGARQTAFAARSGRVTLLDTASGEPSDEVTSEDESWWSGLNGDQLITVSGRTLRAFDVSALEERWSVALDGDPRLRPLFAGGQLVIFYEDRVETIDGAGRLTDVEPLPAMVAGRPQLLEDLLIVPLITGEVVRLRIDGVEADLPTLGGNRVWQLPPSGRFRLVDREVSLRLRSAAGGVFDITVVSTPPQDLLLTVITDGGSRIATNMGKVELSTTVRAALEPDQTYRLEIVRTAPPDPSEIRVETAVVQ